MELQEIMAKLSPEEAAIVTKTIEDEKTRGISESRKKGEEVKKYMTEVNKYRDAIKTTFGIDEIPSDADLTDFLANNARQVGSKEKETELSKLKKDVERVNKLLADQAKEKQQLQLELNNKTINSTLSTVMKDQFHGYDLLIKDLISSNKVKVSNGDVYFVDGESEIDVATGLDALKTQRPDLVRNTQAPGGGSSGAKSTNMQKTMSRASFEALPGKDRASFIASGGKIT